ncbi:hypothetical protein H8E52_10910 [bacterium]|nr:hypothetical protein [bacterium]
MEALLEKLIHVYRREIRLYREIHELVNRQRQEILSGASYGQINESLRAKRDLLVDIEELELGIRNEKELWQRRNRSHDGESAATLMVLLAVVTEAVEGILEAERENELLLTTRRRNGIRPVIGSAKAKQSYQVQEIVEGS